MAKRSTKLTFEAQPGLSHVYLCRPVACSSDPRNSPQQYFDTPVNSRAAARASDALFLKTSSRGGPIEGLQPQQSSVLEKIRKMLRGG